MPIREQAGPTLVRSPDGTPIAVWRSGRGPPLLLVHGMVADHSTTWRHVRPLLEAGFTLHLMDRRGRSGSGDGPGYALEREAEDVASVVDAIGEPTYLVGHSFGGLVALEATRHTSYVRRLVSYEGIPLRGSDAVPDGITEALQAMLEEGREEELLVHFLRRFVGISEEELALLRADAEAWETRVRNAPTIPRELAAQRSWLFEPMRFAHLSCPTLLLVGSRSPQAELEWARAVAHGLDDARVTLLEGEGHLAMYTAPERFVRALEDFGSRAS